MWQDVELRIPVQRSDEVVHDHRVGCGDGLQDLESEGVSDLNFEYVELIVREFQTKPGLLARLLSPGSQ